MKIRNHTYKNSKFSGFVRMIAVFLIAFAGFAVNANAFSDLPQSHWAYNDITEFSDRGFVNGYEDGTYRPENTVTRGEWSKMLCDFFSLYPDTQFLHLSLENCADMSAHHWASAYMVSVNKFLPSYLIDDITYYFPDNAATREEVAISLVKIINAPLDPDFYYSDKYTDFSSISAENQIYINTAIKLGIIRGYEDNTIKPGNPVTRAESVRILNNIIKKIEDNALSYAQQYFNENFIIDSSDLFPVEDPDVINAGVTLNWPWGDFACTIYMYPDASVLAIQEADMLLYYAMKGEESFKAANNAKLGNLRLGISPNGIWYSLGAPESTSDLTLWEADGLLHQTLYYPSQGLEINTVENVNFPNEESFSVYSINATAPCTLKTNLGIGIGSTMEEVINAYSDKIGSEGYISEDSILVGSMYCGILFRFENNMVTQIFIGPLAE